ncbi:DUF2085 domain-containing protein [Evansella sp. AB-rgal1]|uniref:DUF2085 domain-containing protein n=1 Tax=Evansella sp. AB-rgal1 TaxID=3242696 RepID=UPI00359EE2F9
MKEEFGKVPLCNGKCERAPHIREFCFPLCWRCTSMLVSVLLFFVIHLLFEVDYPRIGMVTLAVLSILFLAPMIMDGLLQYVWGKESTNRRRVVTGFVGGIGICMVAGFIELLVLDYFDSLRLLVIWSN